MHADSTVDQNPMIAHGGGSAATYTQTVLVVEDEPILLWDISDELRAAGYTVLEARNADVALSLLETTQSIAAIFTDIDMPGSINGFELSKLVKEKWPPVKIIITSGLTHFKKLALPENAVFIPKPYSPEKIVSQLQVLL